MSEPFLAEIKMVGFNFAPRGWSFCDGQILPINQNQSLYSLLGTTYGGDGRTSFALPDLRGRTPIHSDGFFPLGSRGGVQSVALTINEIPSHDHQLIASGANATSIVPQSVPPPNNVLADSAPNELYGDPADLVELRTGTVANAGINQAHSNEQPFLTLNFCIAIQGLFPSRN